MGRVELRVWGPFEEGGQGRLGLGELGKDRGEGEDEVGWGRVRGEEEEFGAQRDEK